MGRLIGSLEYVAVRYDPSVPRNWPEKSLVCPLYVPYEILDLLDILVEEPFQCLGVSPSLLSHLGCIMRFIKDKGARPTNCPFRRWDEYD